MSRLTVGQYRIGRSKVSSRGPVCTKNLDLHIAMIKLANWWFAPFELAL
jgi:hypothetical protein